MYLFRLGRLSWRIRNLDILEVVLPNGADGVPVCKEKRKTASVIVVVQTGGWIVHELTNSSNERKEPKASQSILEEIWPSRSDKGRALSQAPIVVGGMGSRTNSC